MASTRASAPNAVINCAHSLVLSGASYLGDVSFAPVLDLGQHPAPLRREPNQALTTVLIVRPALDPAVADQHVDCFEMVGRLTAWCRARSLIRHGPAAIRIKLPIWVGASGRLERRISAASVRMTNMTTCSSSRAAASA
jgi:hypothetical protein